jgi:hypothetical protein
MQQGTPQYKRRFLKILHQKTAFILRGPLLNENSFINRSFKNKLQP